MGSVAFVLANEDAGGIVIEDDNIVENGPDLSGVSIHGRYMLDEKLGEGGFGSVYRATHMQMGSDVAIKIMHAGLSSNPDAAKRFALEARRSASLRHPHTISVFDFGTTEKQQLYLVMEYLQGASLATVMRRDGPLDAGRTVHILDQILQALDAAHTNDLIHRDLKPDNIFLIRIGSDDDFVKVLDFGIAKTAQQQNSELTQTGVIIGTPAYMSPEQCAGKEIDHRSDLYALGCLAYAMLAGRTPFVSANAVGYLVAHTTQAHEDVRKHQHPERPIPAALAKWIDKMLAKKPQDRFQSASAARSALTEMLGTSSTWEMRVPGSRRGPTLSRETNASISAPTIAAPLSLATGNVGTEEHVVRGKPVQPTRKKSKGPLILGVAAGAAVLLAVVAIALPSSDPSATTVPPAPTPVVANAAPSDEGKAGASPEQAEPKDAAPEIAKTIRVRVESTPAGARVKLNGREVGKTPLTATWAEGAKAPKAELVLDGFESKTLELAGSDDGSTRSVELVAIAAPTPPVEEVAPTPEELKAKADADEKLAREAKAKADAEARARAKAEAAEKARLNPPKTTPPKTTPPKTTPPKTEEKPTFERVD